MRPVIIGLFDPNGLADSKTMSDAVDALNIQVTKHLPRIWSTAPAAVVQSYTERNPPPLGVWTIELAKELEEHEGGFHFTKDLRPYAKVACADRDWTIGASHEALEMLIDPGGNRLQVGQGIRLAGGQEDTLGKFDQELRIVGHCGVNGDPIQDTDGDVEYLLEICDPCEAKTFAYRINDTWVSDFVTPNFYTDSKAQRPDNGLTGSSFSFRGNIKAPRRIRSGGYITWIRTNDQIKSLEQMTWVHRELQVKSANFSDVVNNIIPERPETSSLRAFIDSRTQHHMQTYCGNIREKDVSHYTLHAQKSTKRDPNGCWHGNDHWVTYHQDGVIERTIWQEGGGVVTCRETVKAHQPIFRPAGTVHEVTNLGDMPLTFDKDLLPP